MQDNGTTADVAPADDDVRPRRFSDRWIAAAALLAAVWSTVLLGLLAHSSEGLLSVVATVAAVASAIAAFAGRLPSTTVSWPTVAPLVFAVLLIDATVSVGWPAWLVYQANRPIDVTAQVVLVANKGVLPNTADWAKDGHQLAGLDVDLPADRSWRGRLLRGGPRAWHRQLYSQHQA